MKVKQHVAAAHKAQMRTVSVLYWLGTRLLSLLIMAWNSNNRLYPVFEWLWRRLGVIWRCMRRRFTAFVAYRPAFLQIWWRKDHGSREEPEVNDENKLPERSCHPEDVEKSRWEEGQHETVAAEKRAAESRREVACKRPKFEDGDADLTEDETELTEDEDDGDEFDSQEYRVETSDEFYCGYDSTWETEEHQGGSFRRTRHQAAPRHVSLSAACCTSAWACCCVLSIYRL